MHSHKKAKLTLKRSESNLHAGESHKIVESLSVHIKSASPYSDTYLSSLAMSGNLCLHCNYAGLVIGLVPVAAVSFV